VLLNALSLLLGRRSKMPREKTGHPTEHRGKLGTSWGVRFSYGGTRHHITLARSWEGGTAEIADEERGVLMRRVNSGRWSPAEKRRRQRPEPAPEEIEAPEFREFASRWLENRELERGKRLDDTRWRLESHLLPFFTGWRLDEIKAEDVDDYTREKLREGQLSAGTINKMLTTLASILEEAVEYEKIGRNVAAGRKRRLPTSKPKRTYLDRAEHISALLDGAEAIDAERDGIRYRRALLAVLAFAGPRIGEALELRWRDVDFADGRLWIRGTKTANADRVVDIVPGLRDELISLAGRDRLGESQPDLRVFRTSKGGSIGATNVRRRILAPAIEKADERLRALGLEAFPEGITPHSLRRTFASILVALGKDPAYVMAQMGHATPGFTLGVYAAAMRARDEDRARLRRLVEGIPIDLRDLAREPAVNRPD
jgi:integrase